MMYKHQLASGILATSLVFTAATSSAAQGVAIPAGMELQSVPVFSPFKQEDQPAPAQFAIANPELRGCRVTMAVKWAPVCIAFLFERRFADPVRFLGCERRLDRQSADAGTRLSVYHTTAARPLDCRPDHSARCLSDHRDAASITPPCRAI